MRDLRGSRSARRRCSTDRPTSSHSDTRTGLGWPTTTTGRRPRDDRRRLERVSTGPSPRRTPASTGACSVRQPRRAHPFRAAPTTHRHRHRPTCERRRLGGGVLRPSTGHTSLRRTVGSLGHRIRSASPAEKLLEPLQAHIDGCRPGATLCLLGDEGVGKSWLVAQGWLHSSTKPLLVVLSPTDLRFPMTADDFEAVLARRLAVQACDRSVDGAHDAWHEFLRRWRRSDGTDRARLLVVIDGINQRPDKDWPRILDYVANELGELGGHLVVTTRTAYYELHVKPRLPDPVEELKIPGWTEAERDSILAAHALELRALRGAHDVDSRVTDALCNPRLLAIALRLLQGRSVAHIGELSISHLLFEHIRVTERDNRTPEPAHETVQRLRAHATHVLERVRSGRIADAAIFDNVEQIADGRFWVPLEGDPTRYRLADDAMILALGFTVVDRLRAARFQTQTLVALLDALLEPILALDDTARAISAALTCACLDGTTTDDIRSALVFAFVQLQNPSVR